MIGEAIIQPTTLSDVTNLILKNQYKLHARQSQREIARLAKDE